MTAVRATGPAAATGVSDMPGGSAGDKFVDFRRVWLAYSDELAAREEFAVEDINLETREGEFIAIVGPSGCGKSTFMKLATGLKRPTRGDVRIAGEPVNGPLKIVGMAFQAPTLLPWRTTLDNVMLPLEIVEPYRSQLRSRRAEFEQRARKLLATVGLAGYEEQFPWQLSGGMQQRASICRALIHEPRMLLLDEPFGALDAFTREELWNVLRDLWSAQRFNVILYQWRFIPLAAVRDLAPPAGSVIHIQARSVALAGPN